MEWVEALLVGGQLLYRNVQRFRGGLVCKAHRPLYHSTLGLRVIKKKKGTHPTQSSVGAKMATKTRLKQYSLMYVSFTGRALLVGGHAPDPE